MAVQRVAKSSSVIDVLDHVLDKGIVVDAWIRVSLIGLDLASIDARVFAASIETCLKHAQLVARGEPIAHPRIQPALTD